MKRREFIAGLGSVGVWPLATRAQEPAMATIGWLDMDQPAAGLKRLPDFKQGLAEMGYVEGRNLVIEYRAAEGHDDRLLALAADLVRHRVMAIVANIGMPLRGGPLCQPSIPEILL